VLLFYSRACARDPDAALGIVDHLRRRFARFKSAMGRTRCDRVRLDTGSAVGMPRHAPGLESPTAPPSFFSALCGNRVGFPGDEVQTLCDEILPPLSLMGEAHSLEASHF
jgi:hypothetical protein